MDTYIDVNREKISMVTIIYIFFAIDVDLKMKYKEDIHMKFKVPLPTLSENVPYQILTTICVVLEKYALILYISQ